MSSEVGVVSAVRSPFGKFGGALRDFTLPELGGIVVAEAIRRAGIDPGALEEVATGVNLPGADRSIARQVLIEAGIPPTRVAYTIDRACCSSMAATSMASRSIRLGDTRIAVAGGTENMSRVPYFLTAQRWGNALGDVVLKDQLVIADPMTGKPRAVQAGEEAVEYGITRAEQDAWAVRSHENYLRAWEAGKFAEEIMPISVPQPKGEPLLFTQDESVRPGTTLEKLAALPTIYGSPTVTAGNAPGLNTGASARPRRSSSRWRPDDRSAWGREVRGAGRDLPSRRLRAGRPGACGRVPVHARDQRRAGAVDHGAVRRLRHGGPRERALPGAPRCRGDGRFRGPGPAHADGPRLR